MTIRTQLKAGKMSANHNEALQVRSGLEAGKILRNHNETLQVRTGLQGGKKRSLRWFAPGCWPASALAESRAFCYIPSRCRSGWLRSLVRNSGLQSAAFHRWSSDHRLRAANPRPRW